MSHWADDSVTAELKRNGGQMTVPALQEKTGLGATDLSESLQALAMDGLVAMRGDVAVWQEPSASDEDDRAAAELEEDDDETPASPPPRAASAPSGGLTAAEAILPLIEQLEGGEQGVVEAICELRTNADGILELTDVKRVIGFRVDP